jgi:hypothetical protein
MKAPTILLLSAAAIGAIAFQPSAASAEVSFSLNIGTPVYQPVIIEQRNPEWRYREEERIREERRLAEQRENERLAERRERERIADRRLSHNYNSNNYQRDNFSNNTQRDRYGR